MPREHYRAGLAALLPVIGGQEDAVRETLRQLPTGAGSPFARLQSTHFARLVLVPGFRDRRDRELAGGPACLFFSAEFDIPVAGYLEALCTVMPEEADAIFDRCEGYPGIIVPPAFTRWMVERSVPAGFSLHGNAGPSAGDVADSLRLRDRIIAFAVDTRALDPDELKRRWDAQDWEAPA
jgi:hypothetical protein